MFILIHSTVHPHNTATKNVMEYYVKKVNNSFEIKMIKKSRNYLKLLFIT